MNYKHLFLLIFLSGCSECKVQDSTTLAVAMIRNCVSGGGDWSWDSIISTPTQKELHGHCTYRWDK